MSSSPAFLPEVFSYLSAVDQFALRNSCREARHAFNVAVGYEHFIAAAGSNEDVNVLDDFLSVEWFPIEKQFFNLALSTKLDIQLPCSVVYNLELMFLNSIPDGFLFCNSGAKHIFLLNGSHIETIGSGFLGGSNDLVQVSFQGFADKKTGESSLRSIGKGFLWRAKNLICFDSVGLQTVTTIDDYWLWRCSLLTSFDATSLTSLSMVGSRWLMECSSLQRIDCTGLAALTTVGDGWLYCCESLVEFDGGDTHLSSLVSVGDIWLSGCRALTLFNGNSLVALAQVGDYWMEGCDRLKEFRGGSLRALNSVGRNWLSDCPLLELVEVYRLPDSVGVHCFENCPKLQPSSVRRREDDEEEEDLSRLWTPARGKPANK